MMPVPAAMQGFFKIPWYADNNTAKVSQQPSDDKMDASPATQMCSSDSKRKRTASPEPLSPPRTLAKKPRAAGDRQYRLPLDVSQTPYDTDFDQSNASLAYATPGATPTALTHRPDYMSSQSATLDKMASDGCRPNITWTPTEAKPGAQRRDSGAAAFAEQAAEARKSSMQSAVEDEKTKTATKASNLTALQQAIENQINMQILMKHNELRLIEQETAKIQVALEQLRRCELKPFPGAQGASASVSSGTGPAVQPRSGFTRPSHAAPYGVADGPYTRHYGKWLLADPQFDSEPIRAPSFAESAAYAANRSTRNSGTARKSVGKTVPAPAQFADYPASIPNYPPPAPARKEKSGPLILRRSTDGKLVKLICNNCGRGDMNSIQGFLNHCRIAHKIDYKSHDAAATDCGHAMDEDELAKLPAEAQSIPVSKPTPRPTPARASVSATQHMTHHAVHPFNVPGAKVPQSTRQNNKKRKAMSTPKVISTAAKSQASTPFKASSQAPRLSALFAKNNVGGDLEQAIANAKQKVDLSAEEDTSSPDISSPASPAAPLSGAPRTLNAPGAGLAARPPSRKGHRQPTQQRPRPSPLAPSAQPVHSEIPESPHLSTSLSPHTADSAPGLISDMEDDDHGSASEEESAIAPSRGPMLPVSRTCADNMDLDIAVDDEMDEHGVIIRRNSMLGSDDNRPSLATASSSSSRKLAG